MTKTKTTSQEIVALLDDFVGLPNTPETRQAMIDRLRGPVPMNTLTFTDREVQIIAAALAIISPSGGGSEQFTLLRSFRQRTPNAQLSDDDDLLLQHKFCNVVINEAREAGAI